MFAHFTSTHNHSQDTKSMHTSVICLKSQVFTVIVRALWFPQQVAIETIAAQGLGNKKIATTLACRSRRRSAAAEAALGRRQGVAQRQATPWRRSWFVSRISRPPLLHDTHVLKCHLYSPQCFKPVSHGFFCRTISRVSIALVHQISFTIQLLQVHQICRHFPPTCITERGQAAIGCSRKWIPRLRIVPLK